MPEQIITCYIPQLVPQRKDNGWDLKQFNRLWQVLSKARIRSGLDSNLAKNILALGNDSLQQHTLSYAALRGLADGIDTTRGYWLCCDPIAVILDHRSGFIQANTQFNYDQNELQQIQHELSATLAQANWLMPHSQRWYLQLQQPPKLHTITLLQALTKDLLQALPQGPDKMQWHALLTEWQLLLHSNRINQKRVMQGMPAANSIWLWGGGELPLPPKPRWQAVYSDNVLAQGMAKHSRCFYESLDQLRFAPGNLIIDDRLLIPALMGEVDTWFSQLQIIEDTILIPLLDYLNHNKKMQAVIHSGNGKSLLISRAILRRFWGNKI